jgi:hypothetical protein
MPFNGLRNPSAAKLLTEQPSGGGSGGGGGGSAHDVEFSEIVKDEGGQLLYTFKAEPWQKIDVKSVTSAVPTSGITREVQIGTLNDSADAVDNPVTVVSDDVGPESSVTVGKEDVGEVQVPPPSDYDSSRDDTVTYVVQVVGSQAI